MSRQSYHRSQCRLCGGDTAGNGFARHAHEHSQRHIDALTNAGRRIEAAILQQERDADLARRAKYRQQNRERRARG